MDRFLVSLQTFTVPNTDWDETVAGMTYGVNDKEIEVVEKGFAGIVISRVVSSYVLYSIFYTQRGAEVAGLEAPVALVDGMTYLLDENGVATGNPLFAADIEAYFVDHPLVTEFHPNGLPD